MLAIDFSIYHHGCPASQSTERYGDVKMKILASNPFGTNRASVLQYATSPGENEIERFLTYWRNHSSVVGFAVAEKQRNSAVFSVSLKSRGGWVTKAILENDGVFSTPIPVLGGLGDWSVMLRKEDKSSLFSQLESVGVVKVNQIREVELAKAFSDETGLLSDLSARQLSVLKIAFRSGYFEFPKRVGSRELAKLMGISQSTLLEHLRKAQSKLIRRAFSHL